MIVVVNKRTNAKRVGRSMYIGRPSPLGNPFTLRDYTRADAIMEYQQWLRAQLDQEGKVKDAFEELVLLAQEGDLTLECWCRPHACHGDVIIGLINERLGT